MGGGLMQLVAYGAQDIYLTGSPSITFWKVVYRRYTQFALEAIEQTFNGTVGYGKRVSCTISRNGDLVSTMWLEIVMKRGTGTAYFPAEQFIKECEIEIGGQRIDRVYSDWYRIYDELFRSGEEKAAYERMTNFDADDTEDTERRFYVPLLFWCNKHVGNALPLIALQYHECRINITFASAEEMEDNGVKAVGQTPSCTLYCTYVFLDTDERRRYAQSSHEYLITQLQHTGAETISPGSTIRTANYRLNYNHPTRFIAWVAKGSRHGEFTSGERGAESDKYAPIHSVKLQLNGQDRFDQRHGSYFSYVQPFEHLKTKPSAGIYMYNFGLRPDETQPSGSCNLSRIDNATLIVSTKAATVPPNGNVTSEETTYQTANTLTNLLVYAENFNVLRCMSGMAGLAYSN
jgi:hypothetical protein